ncbi:MAG: helix-turn-helix domain-containing protein [Nakamurella sp.]
MAVTKKVAAAKGVSAKPAAKSAARATGKTALKKGVRITGASRDSVTEKVRQRYQSGESIRSMAADLGRSYGFVHRILVDAKVPLRGRGGATRGKKN